MTQEDGKRIYQLDQQLDLNLQLWIAVDQEGLVEARRMSLQQLLAVLSHPPVTLANPHNGLFLNQQTLGLSLSQVASAGALTKLPDTLPLLKYVNGENKWVLIHAVNSVGGHHSYATIAERDAIITDLRRWGMTCTVYNNTEDITLNGTYILQYNEESELIDNTCWLKETSGGVMDVYIVEHPTYPIEYLNKLVDGQEIEITQLIKPNGVIFGGNVTWLAGLQFVVSETIYYMFGSPLGVLTQIITLDPAHPDLPRIDSICVTSDQQVVILKGIANANPQKPTPSVDQIELTNILVPAGATTPGGGGIVAELIYDENTIPPEWTVTATGVTINAASTNFPFYGTKCIETQAMDNTDAIILTRGVDLDITGFDKLSFNLKLKATIKKQYTISVQFMLDGAPVSLATNAPFNIASTEWQNVTILLSSMGITSQNVDQLRIVLRKQGANDTIPGMYLDFIKVEKGIDVPPSGSDYGYWNFNVDTANGIVETPIVSHDKIYFQRGTGINFTRSTHVTLGHVFKIDVTNGVPAGGTLNQKLVKKSDADYDTAWVDDESGGNYTYIAFASDAIGTGFTLVHDPLLTYCAILNSPIEIANPVVGNFAGLWYKRLGTDGQPGSNGDSAYVYIAYASDANGAGFTTIFNAALNYIAIKPTTSPIANPQASDFAGLWKNYKGATGNPGAPGAPGADGDDAYVYIAYASDANGTGFTMVFNPDLDYIAIKSTNTAIPAPAVGDFAGLWKNYKGNDGAPGAPGAPGQDGIGVPSGGLKSQLLRKRTNLDYDTEWYNLDELFIPSTPDNLIAKGIKTSFYTFNNQQFGDLIFINSKGKAEIATASDKRKSSVVGILIESNIAAGQPGKYLLHGFIRNDNWNWEPGSGIYLSTTGTTGNTLTSVKPSNENAIRLVAIARSSTVLYFNPNLESENEILPLTVDNNIITVDSNIITSEQTIQ